MLLQLFRQEILYKPFITLTRKKLNDDFIERHGYIEAVDDAAIARVVARWRGATPTLAALGPLGSLEEFDRLRARLGG